MDITEYYIWVRFIDDSSDMLSIPLCHYNKFIFEMEIEAKNKKTGIYEQYTGNVGGKNGSVEIDKLAGKVIREEEENNLP